MKLGIFTDPHYSSQTLTCSRRYNSRSLEKIRQACAAFSQAGCDLVLCLGDLIDREDSHEKEIQNLSAAGAVLRASGIPTVCLMGNHDAFAFTPEEFYAILGPDFLPTDRLAGDKHLLFLDACHFRTGAHYRPGDSDWTDTFYPHAAALEARLSELSGDVYIFLHQNVDPEIPSNHCLSNAPQLRDIFLRSGKVRGVFQGHYHRGHRSIQSGIPYVTFPAMCENDNAWFLLDL